MQPKPKLSVTGYRAIWGKDLNEKIAFEYVRTFAKFIRAKGGKKIIVGRDARKTGPAIFSATKAALGSEDLEMTYVGIIPTPSMLLLTKDLGFDGGIMITASHNPPEYNGVKFIMPEGRLTNEEETAKLEDFRKNMTEEEKILPELETEEPKTDNSEFRKIHIKKVLANIDVELIRSKKFKVALDPINSAGSIIAEELLKELGCEVHIINGTPDGNFAHTPEPLEKNLAGTLEFMKKIKPDVGFVQDPDADRLVLVDNHGDYILEELMVTLVIKSVLSRPENIGKQNTAVVNLSTTKVCDDVAKEYDAKLYRTKVGEANVVARMIATNAPVGGEGSGGAIYPRVGYFRDSLSGMSLILELLAREDKKISEIVASLPKYFMKKDKYPLSGRLEEVYAKLKDKFQGTEINTADGVRFDWTDSSWVHIRPSNTEPIVRVFGEAKTPQQIEAVFKEVRLTLEGN